MLKHLVVIAVLLSGCGPQDDDACTGSGTHCGELSPWPGRPADQGTTLFQCVDGHTKLIYCESGCTKRGAADVCN